MKNPTEQIESLINRYNALTNGVARARIYECAAWSFLNTGFTEDDLELVVKWIQRENSRNDYKHSLDLRRLLGDLERFNDMLSMATVWKAANVRTPRQAVIDNFRRFRAGNDKAALKSVGEIIKGAL